MPDNAARTAILARIRGALAQPVPLPERPDFAAPVHPPLPAEDLAVVFAANFQRSGGEFYYCESPAHLAAHLASFWAKQPALAPPYVWEPELQQLLADAKVPFRAGEDDFRQNADLGLTSCEALVARTGSVLVSAATAGGRRLSIYPDQHLVVARPGQVVAEIGDALQLMQDKYGAGLPSMISLTTGPSRTADIEKTLVLGAHGPRRLALFLLDDNLVLGA
ncbi:lactate utilization protein C [uncultured Hymenobacter sp.]|uniref:LutC/YkgG family protein n=1 Tax=uncultured Hymenobacter sp. TaxID=170016 RepID=UPI0035CC4449